MANIITITGTEAETQAQVDNFVIKAVSDCQVGYCWNIVKINDRTIDIDVHPFHEDPSEIMFDMHCRETDTEAYGSTDSRNIDGDDIWRNLMALAYQKVGE